VVVARDTARLRRILSAVMSAELASGLALLLIAGWLTRVATRAGLRPLASLAEQVTRIDAASLTNRLPAAGMPPELRPIVEQLNSLLARLHSAFSRERRFSVNVAHELLTPVTELRALAENAVRCGEDKEATGQFAANALDTARQMERLVHTLLAVPRSERGELRVQREPVDIAELVLKLQDQHSERAAARNISLECSLAPHVTVQTDRAACESILQNLFENAVEYTPEGGRIHCRLEQQGGATTLTLVNTNPGLTSADLSHLGEPFWRKDTARADRAHVGLGSALVKALAAALRFDLRAAMLDPDLFQITLCIPGNGAATDASRARNHPISSPAVE